MDADSSVSGLKRKAGIVDGGLSSEPAASRKEARLADVAAPVGMKVLVATSNSANVFNEHFLRFFYDPDSKSDSPLLKRDYFSRREFCFTMENDVFIRYLCFRDAEEMTKAVQAKQPHKIDIGPVCSAKPSMHATVKTFKPEERELIFDIDMDAYDAIRTCCKGAKLCAKCWAFIAVAVKVLDGALRGDFGFKNIMFVYSGRRGVHCWVSDEAARTLDNAGRVAVAEYLSALSGGSGGGGGGDEGGGDHSRGPSMARTIAALTVPLHPSLIRAYAELEPVFEADIIPEAGQGLLAREDQWVKLLDAIPAGVEVAGANLRDTIAAGWAAASSPAQRWRQLKDTVAAAVAAGGGAKDGFLGRTPLQHRGGGGGAGGGASMPRATRALLEKLVPAIVFTWTYPRLDIDVSKTVNHLLKGPFCVHPKTGRVCVPFEAAAVDAFDPLAVPTVAQLTEEVTLHARAARAAGAGAAKADEDEDGADRDGAADVWRHTSLRPYIELFERFVRECEGDVLRARRAAADKAAAAFGDF